MLNQKNKNIIAITNAIILGKYPSGTITNKALLMAIKNAEEVADENGNKYIISSFQKKEFFTLAGISESGKAVCEARNGIIALGGLMLYKELNKALEVTSLIEQVSYESRKVEVLWTQSARNFLELKGGYTKLELETMMKLSANAYRLYATLKSMQYRHQNEIEIGLEELKKNMGLINTSEQIKRNHNGKYAVVVKDLEYKLSTKYELFADFKKRALDPSVKEINEKTDLTIAYKKKNNSKHRVEAIIFTIQMGGDNKDVVKFKRLFAENDIYLTDDEIADLLPQLTVYENELGYIIDKMKTKENIKSPYRYLKKSLENLWKDLCDGK